eukprot:2339738-Amphidinium_carterae.2
MVLVRGTLAVGARVLVPERCSRMHLYCEAGHLLLDNQTEMLTESLQATEGPARLEAGHHQSRVLQRLHPQWSHRVQCPTMQQLVA